MNVDTEIRRDVLSQIYAYCDERAEPIVPIAAREVGSRARNLDGPDSDYDVMVIYVRHPADAIFGGVSDSFETSIHPDDTVSGIEIEIEGWSLDKFVGTRCGILDSNPSVVEFAQSRIRYMNESDGFQELCSIVRDDFAPVALIMHSRSMAKRNYRKYIESDNDVSDKRYINIIEQLFRSIWIETMHDAPPNDVESLIRSVRSNADVDIPEPIVSTFASLCRRKQLGNDARDVRYDELDEWIEAELDRDIDHASHAVRSPDSNETRRIAKECYTDIVTRLLR